MKSAFFNFGLPKPKGRICPRKQTNYIFAP